MACIVYLTIGVIITTFFSEAYQAAIPAARIFCVAAFVASIAAALSNFVIIPRGAASILVWSALTALCVSLLIQLCLIPKYGAAGDADRPTRRRVGDCHNFVDTGRQALREDKNGPNCGCTVMLRTSL